MPPDTAFEKIRAFFAEDPGYAALFADLASGTDGLAARSLAILKELAEQKGTRIPDDPGGPLASLPGPGDEKQYHLFAREVFEWIIACLTWTGPQAVERLVPQKTACSPRGSRHARTERPFVGSPFHLFVAVTDP